MACKCLLVSLAGTPKILSDFVPDNGLASLAACLLKSGHEALIRDYNHPELFSSLYPPAGRKFLKSFAEKVFLLNRRPSAGDLLALKGIDHCLRLSKKKFVWRLKKKLLEEVKKNRIDFLGLKLWAGEGFQWSLEVADFLKKNVPGLRVFGGGPQVDIFGQHIFSVSSCFDALCYGEGEETVVQLAEFTLGKMPLAEVPNIYYQQDGRIVKNSRKEISSLDELPNPVYQPEVYKDIHKKIKMFVIDESRGCVNRCFFCIHPVKSGDRRAKSPSRILKELKHYQDSYGVSLFRFAGSSTPSDLMGEVARLVLTEGLNIKYSSFGSLREFKNNATLFPLLKRSGCQSIFFGVESANETILLQAMNRRVKKIEMEATLQACVNSGIFTVVSVIFPAPFETQESRKETLDFLKKVKPHSILVQFPGIYPGTAWFEQAELFGFSLDKKRYPRQVMTYQIKSLFPPRYWKPLPYRVNGLPFQLFARQTEVFQTDLKKAGLETGVSDEAYLLFQVSGMKTLDEFVRWNRCWLYSGQGDALREEIETINRNSG
ncbi:MAG: radical SAM protein [Candidatus Omnitrophica bacterium]|nr:radical SAM protein [Candidatus Omnitrophota bacterium]